ncbi:4-oxalocrotonate tautomerase [Burkholderia pseudomallei]
MFIHGGFEVILSLHPGSGELRQGTAMPTIHLEMHPGRTLEQKRAFVAEVTRVTAETLSCPVEAVDIVITEVPRDSWAKAGKLFSDR